LLLVFPIRTDCPARRVPRVNHAIIALNVAVYLVTDVLGGLAGGDFGERLKLRGMLSTFDPDLAQFITYQFLHADFWHIAGNMLFLWVFGNSVNSKMGHVPYLLFYLATGIFAGTGFAAVAEGPLMGASGAVAGVTTAFLVLFPRTEVTVFYWLWFYIGTIKIRALWVIGLKLILLDNILLPRIAGGTGTVAYSAHIAGYAFGFVVCSLMLLIRALPRDQYDIIALMKRYHKRQQFKAAMADPDARARATLGRVARPVSVATARPVEAAGVAVDDEIIRLRAQISELAGRHDYAAAAEVYQTLVAKDPEQCLPRRNMLVIANQLMTLNRYPQAAAAYERFLKAYPTGADVIQIRLVLGIIYAKYLGQYDAAQPHLRECAARLDQPEQIEQAKHWLDTAVAGLGGGPAPA